MKRETENLKKAGSVIREVSHIQAYSTFFLCNVVHRCQGACAAQQPGACWELLVHNNLIDRLKLPLSSIKQRTGKGLTAVIFSSHLHAT